MKRSVFADFQNFHHVRLGALTLNQSSWKLDSCIYDELSETVIIFYARCTLLCHQKLHVCIACGNGTQWLNNLKSVRCFSPLCFYWLFLVWICMIGSSKYLPPSFGPPLERSLAAAAGHSCKPPQQHRIPTISLTLGAPHQLFRGHKIKASERISTMKADIKHTYKWTIRRLCCSSSKPLIFPSTALPRKRKLQRETTV